MKKTENKSPVLTEDSSALVMARDRHRLHQIEKKQTKDHKEYQQLLQSSQQKVSARRSRLPKIKLNDELPVAGQHQQLIAAIQQHQIIIVAGETGSGKTTQLPQIAMMAGRGLTGLIGHTQPRRLAARTVSQRIAEELGETLGHSVAYKVRFNEQGTKDAFIRLMTDGILLAELAKDRYLNQYDTIIIDEAHERSLNIDFLLGYLKQLSRKRPDLKIIITSATLDVDRFSAYFRQAPIFQVEGRSFPVEVRYRPLTDQASKDNSDDGFDAFEEGLPRAVVSAVEECFDDAAEKGHASQADILIFASTEREIKELQQNLIKFGPKHCQILPLYARLALGEQQKIFHPSGQGRRIIIATNVAETALTVPNIRYVIDTGFARLSRYSYRSRVQRLPIEAISQAAANQRKGRCGRIAPGVCIRLYSEDDFNSRDEFTEPEIMRTNLAAVILQMQSLALGDIEQFDFIQPPDYRLVRDGQKLLLELGALDEKAKKLTNTGRQMAKMPIDPRLSRMILAGAHFGVLKEMLIIVSALAVQDPRERPADKQAQADQKHALFKQADSDFLFYVNLWNQLIEQQQMSENQRKQFAKQHYLSWLRLREWRQTHQQLLEMSQQLKLSIQDRPASFENLHRALLSGLLSSIAHQTDEKNVYLAVRQQKARLFPASALYKQRPSWLMAFEMVETSQVYLRTIAKIDPDWILLAAPKLLKYHYFEPHWSKKRGLVNAYAQISLFGLIVQAKQLTMYEKIDLALSREIFIRSALVEAQLGLSIDFLQHNIAKLQQIERLEDKLRRRSLMIDEESLYQFYDQRIPETIANRESFEAWYREIKLQKPKFLHFNERDLLAESAPDVTDFADYIQVGDMRLKIKYHFDPSHDRDGANLQIPLPALAQVSAALLSWGVAGWRLNLIESLLRSLPKDLRRELVPIPDTAQALLSKLEVSDQVSLEQSLAKLLSHKGIQTQDFQRSQIAHFLSFYIEVVDEKKRVIAAGRDLAELQARYIDRSNQVKIAGSEQHQTFPTDFRAWRETTVAGVKVKQFAALVASDLTENKTKSGAATGQNFQVTEQWFNDQATAEKMHRSGLLALFKAECVDLVKQLNKQLSKPTVMAFTPLASRTQLEQLLIHATADLCLDRIVWTENDATELFKQQRAQFLSFGQQALQVIDEIVMSWQKIRQLLMGLAKDRFSRAIDDIEDQLDALSLTEFSMLFAAEVWLEFPRYLKAIISRLERLPTNAMKDEQSTDQIDPWMQLLIEQNYAEKYQALHWAVEEFRISLFAQPMKTKYPISIARLNKLRAKIEQA